MSYRELFVTPEPLITHVKEGVKPAVKVLGVPFDATSSYRPGARFGPNAIRQAFMNIEIYSPRLGVDLESLTIEDLGNMRYTSDVQDMARSVGRVVSEVVSEGCTLAILGGEHSLTFGSYRGCPKGTALVIFDAHLDLRDELYGLRLSHATFLRRLTEKRPSDLIILVGPRAAAEEEWRHAEKLGLTVIGSDTIFTVNGVTKLLVDLLGDSKEVYVSIDLDILDPAFAPGVGNPEPAGLSSHQVLELLYALKGKVIAGFDIVELSPPYDIGLTATVAAKFLAEMTCLAYIGRRGA